MSRFSRIVAFAALALMMTISLHAQGTTSAQLTGTATADGAPVPGVTVSVSSTALQGTRTTVTGDNGTYIFASLPPGEYTVRFELQGMQQVVKRARLSLSQTSRVDADLRVAAVAEAITVTAQAANVLETTEVSTNFTSQVVDNLPIGRTVTAIASLAPGVSEEGPNNQTMISGAPSYENLYLVNGAVVNDTIRGQPEAVYIEDALQETTILTGNISAEYGRFTGGVVSAITKSGGNEFSGSLRDSVTNDRWTRLTPFVGEAAKVDRLNHVYEATLGGRIIRDRLWFFGAGRVRETESSSSTAATNIPFTRLDEEERYEGKLTGLITSRHTVVGSYLDRVTTQANNVFGSIVDLRSLTNRELPNSLVAVNYNGVLTNSWLIEGQYSQRKFAFVGGGATELDRIFGTIIRDISTSRRGWSPTFCGVCDDKTRDNEYTVLKTTYFLSTSRMGTHNLVAGAEDFSEMRNENNEQGGSGYRVWGDFIYQGQDVFFRITPGTSYIQNFPILSRSRTSDSTTRSLFVNDKWDVNPRLSFNIGVRYDKNDASDQAGNPTSDDSEFSPRLGVIYDLFGNSRHRISGGYNRYVSKIDNGQNDNVSAAGAPAYFGYHYNGPAINAGAGPYLPTDEVLRRVFAWFESAGGDRGASLRGAEVPGLNTRLEGELTSPSMDEFTIGYGLQVARRSFIRADYISRNFQNFYAARTNRNTNQVTDQFGNKFDVTLYSNSDQGLEREYQGLQLQAGVGLGQRLNLGGNYTWSELRGNADSETSNNATIALTTADSYPEYLSQSWNNPVGFLTGEVEHRAVAWLSYDQPTPIGNFNISVLQRYGSGYAYSGVGSIDLRTAASGIQNPGYVLPPQNASYYFSERGAFRTDAVTRTDLAVNYGLPLGRARLLINVDVLNGFDENAIEDPSFIETRVFTSRNAQCTRPDPANPGRTVRCAGFNPNTTQPVEGTHFTYHPDFGKATRSDAYQLPLTYRGSVGIRF